MPHPALSMLLLLFLLLVMPVWGWLDMRQLKRLDSVAALSRSYVVTIATLWLLALASFLLMPLNFWTPLTSLTASFQLEPVPPNALIMISVGLTLGLLIPVVMARLKPALIERQLAPIQFMLPTTPAQRWLFVLVCLTAGIAEEWIYRGFVLHYLTTAWPGLTGWAVIVTAALLFGVAHIYQGWLGTVATTTLGLFFSLLYLGTGSLLLPMILHTLIDLRILLLLPKLRPATG